MLLLLLLQFFSLGCLILLGMSFCCCVLRIPLGCLQPKTVAELHGWSIAQNGNPSSNRKVVESGRRLWSLSLWPELCIWHCSSTCFKISHWSWRRLIIMKVKVEQSLLSWEFSDLFENFLSVCKPDRDLTPLLIMNTWVSCSCCCLWRGTVAFFLHRPSKEEV